MRTRLAWLLVVLGVPLGTIIPAVAQTTSTMRIAGTVEAVTDDGVVVRPYEGGGTFEVLFAKTIVVINVNRGTLADVKPGAFVGVGATPQDDGLQRAMQVTVFAESQRGLGEGFHPWARTTGGTMTNGTVDETAKSVDEPTFSVKYRGGEKKIVVPKSATILIYSVGNKSDLRVGAAVAIIGVKRKLNDTLEAGRFNVGQGGVIPR